MEPDGPQVESADVVNIKRPKRVLHFSDGVLEEYSEDELDTPQQEKTDIIDPVCDVVLPMWCRLIFLIWKFWPT